MPPAVHSTHNKWPQRAAGLWCLWVLVQEMLLVGVHVEVPVPPGCTRQAGLSLLAPCWSPHPTTCLAPSCTPRSLPRAHSCCLGPSQLLPVNMPWKQDGITEVVGTQKYNCQAASEKKLLVLISSELYLLRADSPSACSFVVGMSYLGGGEGIQKGNKGMRFWKGTHYLNPPEWLLYFKRQRNATGCLKKPSVSSPISIALIFS